MPDSAIPATLYASCPSRLILDQIADKWSIFILGVLCPGPQRFNTIKRSLEGITQKALTQALRRLERNGIIERRVLATSPVAVEYAVTPLGVSLKEPFQALYRWSIANHEAVEEARRLYDERAEG